MDRFDTLLIDANALLASAAADLREHGDEMDVQSLREIIVAATSCKNMAAEINLRSMVGLGKVLNERDKRREHPGLFD